MTERANLWNELHSSETLRSCHGSAATLHALLTSRCPQDWEAISRFAARVCQSRRHMRKQFETRANKLRRLGFSNRRSAWRAKGKHVCRHGTFFDAPPADVQCPCLSTPPSSTGVWALAKFMPEICRDTNNIIAVPFNATRWSKLRPLQNRLRVFDETSQIPLQSS